MSNDITRDLKKALGSDRPAKPASHTESEKPKQAHVQKAKEQLDKVVKSQQENQKKHTPAAKDIKKKVYPELANLAVAEVENETYHFAQQSPPLSHDNLMIESENLKHSKKNHDNSLVKIHANAHTHSKANKDIVIHAKKDRNGSRALS